jgi:GTP cyclohydrolase I
VAIDPKTWKPYGVKMADELASLDALGAVTDLLVYLGEDPGRQGLVDTPRRVVAYLKELTRGYGEDPADYLATVFEDDCDEMVVLTGITFTSLCEHHLLPFSGTATVGYVPDGLVVGLSKLARVVDTYAHRLQLQERLTREIAETITDHLHPKGVGVVLRASHGCMEHRGVSKPGAKFVTSSMTGVLRTKPEARAEFMALT